MDRIQLGFLEIEHGFQVHTNTLHALVEFRQYPLHVEWQSQAAKCLQLLGSPSPDSILTHAFITDTKLPKNLAWQSKWSVSFLRFM